MSKVDFEVSKFHLLKPQKPQSPVEPRKFLPSNHLVRNTKNIWEHHEQLRSPESGLGFLIRVPDCQKMCLTEYMRFSFCVFGVAER